MTSFKQYLTENRHARYVDQLAKASKRYGVPFSKQSDNAAKVGKYTVHVTNNGFDVKRDGRKVKSFNHADTRSRDVVEYIYATLV